MYHHTAQPPLPESIQRKLTQYRRQLLAAGMQEPEKQDLSGRDLYFCRPATAQTAFAVHLAGAEDYIAITYGYASTAFTNMNGNGDALTVYGISDDEMTIRGCFVLCDESEEPEADAQIRQMCEAYCRTEKDELLQIARDRRKAFLHQIAVRLKPLGFRKKGNRWTYPRADGFFVHFEAQKSAYGDAYYFNIVMGKSSAPCGTEYYYRRVAPPGASPLDWQVVDPEVFARFLDRSVLPPLMQMSTTPLETLGAQPEIWTACICDHRKCPHCWVEKQRSGTGA